ncbi:MAG: lamin tail domain-containing protein [Patescibacteria group bacterium]
MMKTKIIGLIVIGLILGFVLKLSFFDSFRSVFEEAFLSGGREVLEIPLQSQTVSRETEIKKHSASLAEIKKDNIAFCSFGELKLPIGDPTIIFNEIAWMGNDEGSQNEWIEIKNINPKTINVSGFQIIDRDNQINFVFPSGTKIEPGGFYLLERNEEATLVSSDSIYSGNLKNSDEGLRLFDSECSLMDEILANPNWPAGENESKKTMERASDFSWQTSANIGGTPRKENSILPPQTKESQSVVVSSATSTPSIIEAPQTNLPSEENNAVSQNPTAPNLSPVVSEIMVGIEGNSNYEFIELYNSNNESIDLTGWTIKKKSSTGSESTVVSLSRLEGKHIQPKKYFLLANEGGYNGGIVPDIWWPKSYTFAYTNNALVLYNPSGDKAAEISWVEIPKDQSWERISWESNQFRVQSIPSPQNSAF